jgi:hypothetical protein
MKNENYKNKVNCDLSRYVRQVLTSVGQNKIIN